MTLFSIANSKRYVTADNLPTSRQINPSVLIEESALHSQHPQWGSLLEGRELTAHPCLGDNQPNRYRNSHATELF
jgi:hypothetical protein